MYITAIIISTCLQQLHTNTTNLGARSWGWAGKAFHKVIVGVVMGVVFVYVHSMSMTVYMYMYIHLCVCVCVCVCVRVCVCSCIFVNGACINVESIPRIEDDLMYQSTLSELAKKRQQQQNDVPIELGVLRIEDPPHCVADPSRCVEREREGGREGGEREREREEREREREGEGERGQ